MLQSPEFGSQHHIMLGLHEVVILHIQVGKQEDQKSEVQVLSVK